VTVTVPHSGTLEQHYRFTRTANRTALAGRATTDASGVARFGVIAAGDYNVYAVGHSMIVMTTPLLHGEPFDRVYPVRRRDDDRATRIRASLPMLRVAPDEVVTRLIAYVAPAARVSGRVVNEHGDPVAGALVVGHSHASEFGDTLVDRTEDDGEFCVVVSPPSEVTLYVARPTDTGREVTVDVDAIGGDVSGVLVTLE
jgi:hypothetical protein